MNPKRIKKIKPSLKPQPVKLYRKIAISFVVLTVLLLLLIAYLSFGRAIVIVTPTKEAVSVDFVADLEEEKPGAPEKVVPGRTAISGKLGEFVVEESREFAATGSKVAQTEVGGTVTIINNYVKTQPLVATTRLLSPEGILFRTKERVDVPAGGKVEVEVYADPATEGAAKLGPTRFTIPGLWAGLQDKIYGESYQSMQGGEAETKVVTQNDLDSAYNELTTSLSQEIINDLKAEMSSAGEIMGRVLIRQIMTKTSSAEVDDEVEKFTATLKFRGVGVAFYRRDLEGLAAAQLAAAAPADKELVDIDYNSLTFVIEKYDLEGYEANIRVRLDGEAILKSDSSILDKNNLIGRGPQKAINYLTSFPEIQDAEVRLSPFWVRKIPRLMDHIEIYIRK